MGCRQSTELVVPLITHNAARDVTWLLPTLLTQGEAHNVARPPKLPTLPDKTVMKPGKEKPPKWNNPTQSTGPLITKTNFNIAEPYLHQQRDVRKDRTIVFVLGGPGCGKGTQCERIVRDFGFLHLSTGELLREEVKKGTPVGQNCESLMKEGKLVPMEITLTLVENAMKNSGKTKFLIDGFPRAVEQAKAFEKQVGMPDKVLFLECPKKVMEERLMKRGGTSGRIDDTPTTIMKRFETFEKESMPVAAYYDSINPNIIAKVSSVPPPDLVYKEIQGALKNLSGLKILI